MEVSNRDSSLSEVIVVFTTDTSHCLLETGQLVLEIFNGIVKNIKRGGFHTNHLPKLIGLENGT